MSVKDALSGRVPGVKNSSIAVQATLFGNLVGGQEKIRCHGCAVACNTHGIFCVQGWDK
jgi:hypothetical protein